jgi:hypothetical protein
VSVFAGSGKSASEDGLGTNASFCNPWGIAIDQQTGNLFICDFSSHKIRKITPQGTLFWLFSLQRNCVFLARKKMQNNRDTMLSFL